VRERAEELARTYQLEVSVETDIREVLHRIDGAVIATPNDTHTPLAITCLEAGVSTLIEKPLASSSEEGLAIVAAAERTRRVAAVGYASRFRESTGLLAQLLRNGFFGQTRRFAYQFGTAGGWAPMSGYNLSTKSTGGGVLVVTGTHFLDRMLHFWGVPDEARLQDDSDGGPEAHCVAQFRYLHGAAPVIGTAIFSKLVRLRGGLVIETDRGIVRLADSDEADILYRPYDGPGIEYTVRRPDGAPRPCSPFELQLRDFVEACQQRRKPLVDAREALESLRLIERLYHSRVPLGADWYETDTQP
jgi:predicted dehydrogenase